MVPEDIKVSIIIPAYNVDKYIKQCVDSAINQTYRDLEIIVVDDGSTDHTPEVLNSLKGIDERLFIFRKENGGLSDARNFGIEKSTGDYILFLDGDDWIDKNTVLELYNVLVEKSVDVVIFRYDKVLNRKEFQKKFNIKSGIYKEQNFIELFRRLIGLKGEELAFPENTDNLSTAWAKLYKRDLCNVKFVDTKVIGTEDLYFNIQVFTLAKSAYFLDKPLYKYRRDVVTSLTSKYKSDLDIKWSRLFLLIKNHLIENKFSEVFWVAYYNRICLSMIGLGLAETNVNNPKNLRERIKKLNRILKSDLYQKAFSQLDFKYFPVNWKIYFLACKYRIGVLVYFLAVAMRELRK